MAEKLCRQCGVNRFQDGYGVRRKVEGVWDQVCNPCAAESVRREVDSTVSYVEGLKLENPDLDWRGFLDNAYKSRRRFQTWERLFNADPSVDKHGYLRVCDDDSTSIVRGAKFSLIRSRLAGAEVTMGKIGRVEVPINTADPHKIQTLQYRQAGLDRMRDRILRGTALVKENLAKLETRGLITGPGWWNLLRDTVAAAVQLHLRVQSYAVGHDQVEKHLAERATRLAAAAVGAEDQEAAEEHPVQVEEEEQEAAEVGTTAAVDEASVVSGVAGEEAEAPPPEDTPTEARVDEAGAEAEEPLPVAEPEPSLTEGHPATVEPEGTEVPTPESPAADKPRFGKKVAKKPKGKGQHKSRRVKINGVDAIDPEEAVKALKANSQRGKNSSRSRANKEAIEAATELVE